MVRPPFPPPSPPASHPNPNALLSAPLQYIFPGLGLGCILARVTTIPDSLIHASAQALADSLTSGERARDLLYPDVERIREVSIAIAVGVIRAAQKEKVDKETGLRSLTDAELESVVRERMYRPLVEEK